MCWEIKGKIWRCCGQASTWLHSSLCQKKKGKEKSKTACGGDGVMRWRTTGWVRRDRCRFFCSLDSTRGRFGLLYGIGSMCIREGDDSFARRLAVQQHLQCVGTVSRLKQARICFRGSVEVSALLSATQIWCTSLHDLAVTLQRCEDHQITIVLSETHLPPLTPIGPLLHQAHK